MKIKAKLIILIFPIFFLVFLAISLFLWWTINTKSPSNDPTKISFLIPKGKSASEVGSSLYKAGLIKSPLAFKIYVQVTDKSKKINTGEFELSKNMSLYEIVDRLGKGPVEIWLTIPEGLRREEVVEKVLVQLGVADVKFRTNFLTASKGLEGQLFPDTYLFAKDVSAERVVKVMNDIFEKKFVELTGSDGIRTKNEIVTMASIIERETKTDEERPVVAGILWKRLDTDGWLIQADASVQYAVASAKCSANSKCQNWWPILTKTDLEINSPFNTYKNKSLPPAPIANPGLSSLKAAINPVPSEYWFYIHDTKGAIHYGKSIEEHRANIAKYLGK